jgi:hypothetical protein
VQAHGESPWPSIASSACGLQEKWSARAKYRRRARIEGALALSQIVVSSAKVITATTKRLPRVRSVERRVNGEEQAKGTVLSFADSTAFCFPAFIVDLGPQSAC